ncbi:hypothetical protein ACSBR1_021850 [Camellia fascicularis]
MSSMSIFIFLLPLTLCLSLRLHLVVADLSTINNVNNLIEKACSNSAHKDFCLSVLNFNNETQNADLKGLAFIALKAAEKNATDTSVRIKLWLGDENVQPSVGDGLSDCDKEYLDAIDQIEDSINALVSNALDDVKSWVEDALADIDTCEKSIQGQPGYSLELARENQVLRKLCYIALDIVQVLATN